TPSWGSIGFFPTRRLGLHSGVDSALSPKRVIDGSEPIDLFYSYSHIDEDLCKELMNHLSPLRHEGVISDWHDRLIRPGTEWSGVIDDHINSASIILLLISSDFIASRYCFEKEMNRALERHEKNEARVIPVILRDVDWSTAPFAKLQALAKDGNPVTSW